MNNIPRIIIAAPSSGSGKTTIVCGILKSLINKKIKTASFKCGPDYIDTLFHKKVLNIESGNLDLFFNNENTVKSLLSKNSKDSDIAVIEGVMGYYDGLAGKSTAASTYHLSRVTKTPVILIINGKNKSLSIIPEIKGFIEYKKDSNIKGVILNNTSPMIYKELKEIIEKELNIKVLGYLPQSKEFKIESRHLGLITPTEIRNIEKKIETIGEVVSSLINIDEIINIANSCMEINFTPINIKKVSDVKIAIARDSAFCFYYKDNINLLKEMGAEIIEFSPLKSESLPKGIHGIILGGGYPELYGEKLSNNRSLLKDIKNKLEGSIPCIAECGGFMYIGKSLEGEDRKDYNMVNFFNHHSFKRDKLSRFGYINLIANKDNILCKKGESIRGHEFHYWDSNENGNTFKGEKPLRNRSWNCINYKKNTLAGYPHFNFYSNLDFAYNFIKKCSDYKIGEK